MKNADCAAPQVCCVHPNTPYHDEQIEGGPTTVGLCWDAAGCSPWKHRARKGWQDWSKAQKIGLAAAAAAGVAVLGRYQGWW
jgi:hypothetical protein